MNELKPSKEIIDKFRPVISFVDLITECFCADLPSSVVGEDQEKYDAYFTAYLLGLVQPISPDSKFNREFHKNENQN